MNIEFNYSIANPLFFLSNRVYLALLFFIPPKYHVRTIHPLV